MLHFAENNGNSRSDRNGETWLLRQLIAHRIMVNSSEPMVLFDVGANVGHYTRLALREARAANCAIEVHAFEPYPRNCEILRRTFTANPNVRISCVAVGDKREQRALYSATPGSSQASLLKRSTLGLADLEEIRVPVIRLDEYMATENISRLDLLKLDIEGAELAALHGLGDRLEASVVEVIQFEYGGTALDAGTTLRDFYQLLIERGYAVAKLFPHSLELRPYHLWMEHYAYANYVALSPKLLRAVKA
jgi:FkbM family methyltransferase